MNNLISKYFPIFIIIFSVFVFFYPFIIKGNLPIPSDTIIGLYHPFRDLYSDQYPNGIPYKNSLITDPVRQQYPWKNLAINLEKEFKLPLWNPYEMAGIPLLSNFQSSPFYPLNLILFIEPFSISWSLFIMIEPLLAGLFLYFYLKSLKLNPWSCLLGSITWIFSGFFIVWLTWGVVLHTVLWLPLILLSIDKGFLKRDLRWKGVFILSLSASLLAGHLQTFFYVFIFSLVYFFSKLFFQKNKIKILGSFIFDLIIVATVTFIQWFPTLKFILLSNRFADQSYINEGWFIPWQNLAQFIAPDFFGNPTTLNYFGAWNYAEFVGYVGITSLTLVLYSLIFRHDKKTLFFGGALLASLIFALPTIISSIPFVLNIPFVSSAQPTRLLAITCFSLAVLSALGFDYFLKNGKKIWIPIITVGIVLGSLWIVSYIINNPVSQSNLRLPSIIFTTSFIVLLFLSFAKKRSLRLVFLLILTAIVLFDLIRFGWKFTPFTNHEYLFPQTHVIEFLQNQKGIFRIATTDSRIMPPNFSVVYHLQSIEGYDPLYLKNYAQFIAANERGDHSITLPLGFNRIITPRNLDTQAIDFLNVKYVLSFDEINNSKYKKVFEEGQTKIYENTTVFPRAYFVKEVMEEGDKNKIARLLFESNLLEKSYLEQGPSGRFETGTAQIVKYSEGQIIIKTENQGEGFLVASEVYYPSFHATIDGSETKIYETNLAFRGIIVPAGKHEIIFKPKLF